ncbi:MAG TPA: uroporphyrinogen-III synthase [Vulgatibacter sp.]
MSAGLAGRRIAITRPADSSAGLARLLEAAGASVRIAPAIRRGPPSSWEPLDRGVASLLAGGYDGVLFTSPAAVAPFCERLLLAGGEPARLRHGLRVSGRVEGGDRRPVDESTSALVIGAVGPGTAAALAAVGIDAGIVPAREDGASLGADVARAFGPRVDGAAFLQPRAEEGREELASVLGARGAKVDVVPANRTTRATSGELAVLVEAIRAGLVDVVVFASPSAVDAVLDAAGGEALGTARAVAIGETTAGTLRNRGVRGVSVAATADDAGLFDAIARSLAR